MLYGRAPQGARGLKYQLSNIFPAVAGRAPQGARGLKFFERIPHLHRDSRAPQGARGLKLIRGLSIAIWVLSRPARGAWVEINL